MGNRWLSPWAIWDSITKQWILKSDAGNTPSWEFPARNGYIPITQNDDIYLKHVEIFNKILASAASDICAGEDLSTALPITFTISAQPDVPRNLSFAFVTHANITAYTLVFTGTDAKGNPITDTFTEADGWSGATSQAYALITSIQMTTRTGTGSGDTMNVGTGSILGLANNIDAAADVLKVSKAASAGNAADYSGANVTVDPANDTVDVSTGTAIVAGDSFTIWYRSRFYTQV